MNKKFTKKLIQLYDSSGGRFGKKFPEAELKRIIRFGALGELGENYYLFLYRDFYRDSAYYGSIIFFNKRDELDNPVTVMGVELDGKEQVRNVYVKAALFFLKEQFQDTMAISGSAAMVFEMAQVKINAFIGKESPGPEGQKLEDFDVDIAGHKIHYRLLKTKMITKSVETRGLKSNLDKMKANTDANRDGEMGFPRIEARLGINLKSRALDLSGDQFHFFQPLLIPLQDNGKLGRPQRVFKAELERYELVWDDGEKEELKMLEDFFYRFVYMDGQQGNPAFKVKFLFHLYFQDIAELLFRLPEDRIFYQADKSKEYVPMKRVKFNRMDIRFAPSLQRKREYMLKFYLTFTDGENRVLEARDRYEIILQDQRGVHILFNTPEGETWFAAPGEREQVYGILDFLAVQGECHVSDFDDVLAALKGVAAEGVTIQPEPLNKYELTVLPTPILGIYPPIIGEGTGERLVLEFDYESAVKEFVKEHPDKIISTYEPDEDFERHCGDVLKSDPFLTRQMGFHSGKQAIHEYYRFKEDDPVDWLVERGGKYLEKGFKIYSIRLGRFIGKTGSSVRLQMESDIDWLQFKPMVIDGETGKELEIVIDNINVSNYLVMDKKGTLHLVTKKEIEKLMNLYRFAQPQGDWFRVPAGNYFLIRKLYDERMEELPKVRDILKKEERLKDFEKIPDYPLAGDFNGELRGYQDAGFKWLYFLQDYGFSGCLADDMGLGKTVQTLALLQTLKAGGELKTSLLVLPVSAIPNWEMEIEKFAPGLKYQRHIGQSRVKETGEWGEVDIVITSYATIRNDIEMARDFEFDYVILDESQNIKNAAAQTSKAIKILKARNRLALSGTPVENNSMELWSLFDFLIPGLLGSFQWFSKQFAQAIERDRDQEAAEMLKGMIYPFILRRKKEEVETELPEKIEIVSKLRMDEEQAKLYEETAKFYRGELEQEIKEKGVSGSSMKILEGMLRLRQICLFPGVMDARYSEIPSAKFNHLQGLLEDILAEDHKVLIFSQFVQVLKVIRGYCDESGVDYSYIDGSVKVGGRAEMIKDFQENEENRVFLLSLKAGGVALNLTAADYVIIFDPWWNPAVEAQAIDRSHRIGQTKRVMVYRMVMEGTIEEKMLELQERKRDLVDNLITSDTQTFKDLSRADIMGLFR
ncbi:MAG: DEAD/DEAH box helicase [bacterium]|nr:DEAD/DEAH box helicase [bacterium]